MNLVDKIKKLDNSEKDFLLILLAFILVAMFLFFIGFFESYEESEFTSRVYFGYSEDEINSIKINMLQNITCQSAERYNSCDKINNTTIITSNICCIKMGLCC